MALAIVFVASEFVRNWEAVSSWRPDSVVIIQLLATTVIYTCSMFILAENWHIIVGAFGNEPRRRTYPSYINTQIAKYIPGNFAHFLGRAIYLRGGSLGSWQLAQATFVEIAVMPGSAILLLLIMLATHSEKIPSALSIFDNISIPLLFIGMLFVLIVFLIPKSGILFSFLRISVKATMLSTIFMAILGFLFFSTINAIVAVPIVTAAVAIVSAYIVGYLTPGAPAGLGTREAALLLLLSGLAPEESILISATLFRLVTIGGDILCFLAGSLIFRRPGQKNHDPPPGKS